MFHSATLKLTAWYLAMVMVISLTFSGVVYHFAHRELAHGLNAERQRIYQNFPVFNNDPFFERNEDLTDSSRRILIDLGYFNLLVLVGAGLASYALARRTLQPIEEAHENQKRFTADVSHELRTPLTSLKMESEVALMDASLPKQELRRVIESNLEEASKLESLINNLLKLTSLEAAQLQNSFNTLSAQTLAEQALARIQPQAERKQIKLERQIKDFKLRGDQESLVQLLVILLDNAVKYSPKNSTVKLTSAQQNDRIVFSVEDQGAGIGADKLQHVFDRFYRADKSRAKEGEGGYGLGLSIAKLISDIHKGNITLASQVGAGTTATVELPKN